MKLMELLDSGILQDCKIAVFTRLDTGTAESFTIEIMRGDRPRGWRNEYTEWLRSLDLEVRSVGIGVDNKGEKDTICFHCEPIKLMSTDYNP